MREQVHLRYNEDEEKPANHDLPGVNDSLASTALTTEALGFAMSAVGGMGVQSEEVYISGMESCSSKNYEVTELLTSIAPVRLLGHLHLPPHVRPGPIDLCQHVWQG